MQLRRRQHGSVQTRGCCAVTTSHARTQLRRVAQQLQLKAGFDVQHRASGWPPNAYEPCSSPLSKQMLSADGQIRLC